MINSNRTATLEWTAAIANRAEVFNAFNDANLHSSSVVVKPQHQTHCLNTDRKEVKH